MGPFKPDATEQEQAKTLSVPQAGKLYFGLARNASYSAAARGDLPVIRIGGKLRVPIVALERMLAQAGNRSGQSGTCHHDAGHDDNRKVAA